LGKNAWKKLLTQSLFSYIQKKKCESMANPKQTVSAETQFQIVYKRLCALAVIANDISN